MSALEHPAEVLLVALFHAADRAEATARAFLHSGLDASHVAVLARATRGTVFGAVPQGAVLRVSGVGRVVARGMLAREMAAGPFGELGRLGTALRRVGLSATDIPRLEQATRRSEIVVLAAVPLAEAQSWGRLLQQAGAVSLSARPRLGAWPPEPRPASPRSVSSSLVRTRTRPRSASSTAASAAPEVCVRAPRAHEEGGRMLRSIVAIAGAALLLGATAARPAQAMTDTEVVKAHIPFAFRIPGERMPAGDYEFKPMNVNSSRIIEIRRTDGGGPVAVFEAIPKDSGSISHAQMVFDDVGKEKFLRAILLPGERGVELPVAGAEVRAAHEVAAEANRTRSASGH